MPIWLSKISSTVCRRSRVVSDKNLRVDRTTATRPFSGRLIRSTVMSTVPDQSREKRTGTARPTVSRLACSSPKEKMKYH